MTITATVSGPEVERSRVARCLNCAWTVPVRNATDLRDVAERHVTETGHTVERTRTVASTVGPLVDNAGGRVEILSVSVCSDPLPGMAFVTAACHDCAWKTSVRDSVEMEALASAHAQEAQHTVSRSLDLSA